MNSLLLWILNHYNWKRTGVDVIGEYLERKGVRNYMVNIGGEVRARGNNARGKPWSLGVNVPLKDAGIDEFQEIVALKNKSMASSGNYRNFKLIDGKKVVHTINPKTGYPEISNLLSASVISEECALADAYATACMVVGLEGAKKFIVSDFRLEGLLIFENENGELVSWKSKGVITP